MSRFQLQILMEVDLESEVFFFFFPKTPLILLALGDPIKMLW